MTKTCFIISAIAKEDSQTRKSADHKFEYVYSPVLEDLGYKITRSDKISSPGSISREIVQNLIDADLVIADITDENSNVFYELAIRNAIKKPVIIFRKPEQVMPFDIYDKRAISISTTEPKIWEESKQQLRDQVTIAEKYPEQASESILTEFAFDLKNTSPRTDYDKIYSLLKDIQDEVVQTPMKLHHETQPEQYQNASNTAKDAVTFFVTIPPGSSFPGCEKNNECFIPAKVRIKRGQQVSWINRDNAAHHVMSGMPDGSPNEEFDSPLIMPHAAFSHTFAKAGEYPYFSVIQPWQVGKIIVE